MNDLVKHFERLIPTCSKQERNHALEVIDEQIAMTFASANHAAKHASEGLTHSYRSMWEQVVEQRRAQLTELERVKTLLTEAT